VFDVHEFALNNQLRLDFSLRLRAVARHQGWQYRRWRQLPSARIHRFAMDKSALQWF
jgi:hypothetical protein